MDGLRRLFGVYCAYVAHAGDSSCLGWGGLAMVPAALWVFANHHRIWESSTDH